MAAISFKNRYRKPFNFAYREYLVIDKFLTDILHFILVDFAASMAEEFESTDSSSGEDGETDLEYFNREIRKIQRKSEGWEADVENLKRSVDVLMETLDQGPVYLHQELVLWALVATAQFSNGSFRYPQAEIREFEAGTGWRMECTFKGDARPTQVALVVPVLMALDVLDADALYSDSTVDRIAYAVEHTDVARGDCLPHNIGFYQLAVRLSADDAQSQTQVEGHDVLLFDSKHAVPEPDWRTRFGLLTPRARQFSIAWKAAATWTSTADEFQRQPALLRQPLYREFSLLAIQLSLYWSNKFFMMADPAINCCALLSDSIPINLSTLRRTLHLRQ